jgi:thiamine-phosphate pyrophosphorylase
VTALPTLYPIVDVDVSARAGWDPRDLARAYVAGGARWLQLRAKSLESGAFLELVTAVVDDAAGEGARVIVNDRADIARLSGAAGVHVGQEDLSATDVRAIVGEAATVGLSTHTLEQVRGALAEPISYLAVGPVFGTRTKNTGYDAVGTEMVTAAQALAHASGVPVVAIGGITLENAASVIAAGAASLAVITDLMVGDPTTRVRAYIDLLSR